jgi:hypothetical protein
MRVRRLLERVVLGSMMSVLAFVVERRMVKMLRKKR